MSRIKVERDVLNQISYHYYALMDRDTSDWPTGEHAMLEMLLNRVGFYPHGNREKIRDMADDIISRAEIV